MKKYLITTALFVSVFLGLFTRDPLLWCSRIFSSDPQVHTIQPGEYFSRLSLKYYNTVDYWRELALINRAPDADLVFPGEQVIVPGLEAIQRIRRARSLTAVNSIIDAEEKTLAALETLPDESRPELADLSPAEKVPAPEPRGIAQFEDAEPAAQTASSPAVVPGSSSRTGILALIVLGFIAVAGTAAWIFLKRRKQSAEETEMRERVNSRLGREPEEEEGEVVLAPHHP